MKKSCLLLLTLINCSVLSAQKAFIGGGNSSFIPVANYQDFAFSHKFFGGHSGKVTYAVNSSNGSFVYFDTYDVFTGNRKIHKIDAASETYVANMPFHRYINDLEISDDDAFLFFHSSNAIYKVSTSTMQLVDSMMLGYNCGAIEVYDNNTVFFNGLYYTCKVDFNTHNVVDSVANTISNTDMVFNADKSKIYGTHDISNSLICLSVNPLSVDTTFDMSGLTGKASDVFFQDSTTTLYVYGNGINGSDGMVRAINPNNYSTIADISLPAVTGTGKFARSPDNKLWVPGAIGSSIAAIDLNQNTLDTVFSTIGFSNFYGPYTVAFSPQLLGIGVPEYETNLCKVYPNPSAGLLTISAERNVSQVVVYTITGQEVFRKSTNNRTETIHLEQVSGTYILSLEFEDGQHYRQIIQVQ